MDYYLLQDLFGQSGAETGRAVRGPVYGEFCTGIKH